MERCPQNARECSVGEVSGHVLSRATNPASMFAPHFQNHTRKCSPLLEILAKETAFEPKRTTWPSAVTVSLVHDRADAFAQVEGEDDAT